MAFSDLSNIKDVIKNLDTRREKDTIFLELLACKGGCINGPAKLSQTSLAIKRYNIQQHRAAHPEVPFPISAYRSDHDIQGLRLFDGPAYRRRDQASLICCR